MKKLIILLCFVIVSCSQISVIKERDRSDLYSQNFLERIEGAKNLFRSGNHSLALERLNQFDDSKLTPVEIALKDNLRGVILFSGGKFQDALNAFLEAEKLAITDPLLLSQVELNLASTYYKLSEIEKALTVLEGIDPTHFNQGERRKYFQIYLSVAKNLDRKELILESLIGYLGTFETLEKMKQEMSFSELEPSYRSASTEKRLALREDQRFSKLIRGYLYYLEARFVQAQGDYSQAQSYRELIKDEFSDIPELVVLVEGVEETIEVSSRIEPFTVGVVLPLSGSRASFGKRVLMGIDSALRLKKDLANSAEIKLLVRDSKGSPVVGASQVQELIEKHSVSIVIGGLFSDEAEKQFLETKKRGVFYISLSQVYLLSELKNGLLIEVPGSIQSQLSKLFSSRALAEFGAKGAILYPNNERGQVYLDEFWRQAQTAGITITNVMDYDLGKGVDYRKPVQKLLGLSYPRERKEELELLQEVYELEKNRVIRRVQTLPPVQDFDWVFIPSRPLEAIQIIPSFSYFDAFKVNLIGEPSWRSKRISDQSYKSKKIFFLGDDIELSNTNLNELFFKEYKTPFRVIEMRGHDSFLIASQLLSQGNYSTREEFNNLVQSIPKIQGVSSTWRFDKGFWIKEMTALRFRNGKISEVLSDL